ncbi:hypothetical protein H072_10226 [Dactylellina haptotyla CBS 200.50]|uniref:Uncharacterized protein n=1 Tax=Dactylellina haptotyla (strain CBS 200.50) TaxID=1284197 RepID=S7ZZU5_DACHA|nr:hypothetical protein H072_10226 [Dactylellina haptotyla CBS 200.50]
MNLFYPGLGFEPGKRAPRELEFESQYFYGRELSRSGRRFGLLLYSELIDRLPNLEFVYDADAYAMEPTWFEKGLDRSPSIGTGYWKLQVLKIPFDVSRNKGGRRQNPEPLNKAMIDWLDTRGANFRVLSLRGTGDSPAKPQVNLPTGKGFPYLKSLKLRGLNLFVENTINFLRNCKGTLQEFELKESRFEQRTYEDGPELSPGKARMTHYYQLLWFLWEEATQIRRFELADETGVTPRLSIRGRWNFPGCNLQVTRPLITEYINPEPIIRWSEPEERSTEEIFASRKDLTEFWLSLGIASFLRVLDI